VGDTVNLAQRLQDLARPAGCLVFSEATRAALRTPPECEELGEQAIKGRVSTVRAFRLQVAEDSRQGDPAFSSGSTTGGTP
jgi:class 3 adenylate cyclase